MNVKERITLLMLSAVMAFVLDAQKDSGRTEKFDEFMKL